MGISWNIIGILVNNLRCHQQKRLGNPCLARLSSLGGSSVNRQFFQQAMEIYKLEHHGTSSCGRWPIYG